MAWGAPYALISKCLSVTTTFALHIQKWQRSGTTQKMIPFNRPVLLMAQQKKYGGFVAKVIVTKQHHQIGLGEKHARFAVKQKEQEINT